MKSEELIKKFVSCADKLPYAKGKITADSKYRGWVSGFGIYFGDDEMRLDLKVENHVFLLFVLAVAWSRSGQWENAAYFTAYLCRRRGGLATDSPEYWKRKENRILEKRKSRDTLEWIKATWKHVPMRKKISFRDDIYDSVGILADRWDEVRDKLEGILYPQNPDNAQDACLEFIHYLRSIPGLAGNGKRMFMKIPLVLRELRCQGCSHIPGEYCCVLDARVKAAAQELGFGIRFANSHTIPALIKNSRKVYSLFGDLYDIPLFAYHDLSLSGELQ